MARARTRLRPPTRLAACGCARLSAMARHGAPWHTNSRVGILIVINTGAVWGRANGAVWGSRKVRRKGCIRAMGDVPLDPRFGRGVAFRYGQRRGGDGEGSNPPSFLSRTSVLVPGLSSLSSERRCDVRNLRRRQEYVGLCPRTRATLRATSVLLAKTVVCFSCVGRWVDTDVV